MKLINLIFFMFVDQASSAYIGRVKEDIFNHYLISECVKKIVQKWEFHYQKSWKVMKLRVAASNS